MATYRYKQQDSVGAPSPIIEFPKSGVAYPDFDGNNISPAWQDGDTIEFLYEPTGVLYTYDLDIKTWTNTSTGGSIEVTDCPPGMDDVNGVCTPNGQPVDPGTLWYNPHNGITYIWKVNAGTDDGQWVDVRPGGEGGGGGSADLSDYIIRQCDEPDGDALGLQNGTIWVKVCNDPATGDPICPNEMYLWCTDGAGDGTWNPIEGGSGGGGLATPQPELITSDPSMAGSGTETDPYIIPETDSFKKGDVYSTNKITMIGLKPGALVTFTDEDSVTNQGNFSQPIGTVNSSGNYTFNMYFKDYPGIPTTTYVAKLKSGDVYFTWKVNVLDKGIESPTIINIQDLGGSLMAAPSAPSYITGTTVGNVIPVNSLTGLTDGETVALSPSGGSGNDLSFTLLIDGGEIDSAEIINAGSGYNWNDTVTVDLSSYGGSSSEQFIVHTTPISGPLTTIQPSDFVSDNAGNFELVEWEFSDTEDFASSTKTTSTVKPTSTNTISTTYKTNNGDVYYFRIRYKSDQNVYSSWSNIVRTATGPVAVFSYRLTSYIPNKGFFSNDVKIPRIAHSYVSVTCNMKTDGTEKLNGEGVIGPYGGNTNCYKDNCNTPPDVLTNNGAGKPVRVMVYLQVRQPIRMIITGVDGSGSVTNMEQHPDDMKKFGLPDNVANGTGVTVENVVGTGTGLTVHFTRTSNGLTSFTGWDSGTSSGYAVNDIVMYQPLVGNGSPNSLDKVNDTILHGMPGRGGNAASSAKYCSRYEHGHFIAGSDHCNGGNITSYASIPNPSFSDIYPKGGQSARRGEHCTGGEQNAGPGGGGGAGWTGGGHGNSNGTNRPGGPGGTGGQILNPMVTDGEEFATTTFDGTYIYSNFGNEPFKKVIADFDYLRVI